jgi:hypothetical protein
MMHFSLKQLVILPKLSQTIDFLVTIILGDDSLILKTNWRTNNFELKS